MNIIYSYPFFNEKGGIERHLVALVGHLNAKHNITVMCYDSNPKLIPNVNYLLIPYIKLFPFLEYLLFSLITSCYLLSIKSDIIHIHGASGLTGDVVTAHSVHKAWFINSLQKLPFLSKSWILKILNPVHYVTILIEYLQYNFFPLKVIAVSNNVKNDLITYYQVKQDNITVIYNGTDTNVFNPDLKSIPNNKLKNELHLSNELVIGFVANEFKRKGLQTLIRSLHKSIVSNYKVVVIGKDDPLEYQDLIKYFGLEQHFIFAGSVENVQDYFSLFDLFILPTVYEAFGLVILEAMSYEIPIIVSKVSGVEEFVIHNFNGLMVEDFLNIDEWVNTINYAIQNPIEIRRMAQNGRQTALQMDWSVISEQTASYYHDLKRTP